MQSIGVIAAAPILETLVRGGGDVVGHRISDPESDNDFVQFKSEAGKLSISPDHNNINWYMSDVLDRVARDLGVSDPTQLYYYNLWFRTLTDCKQAIVAIFDTRKVYLEFDAEFMPGAEAADRVRTNPEWDWRS